MDGAGKVGSAYISSYKFILASDFERQNKDGYERTIVFNGNKAIEKVRIFNKKERTELTTLIKNRYLITLKGENTSIDRLKQNYSQFDFSLLK